MVVERGQIWWADLGEPGGSEPGFRRPVVVVSTDSFNESRISTVVVAAITSNLRLAQAPGNVCVPVKGTGLKSASVVNVSQIVTLDKASLSKRIGRLNNRQMEQVDDGLRLVLGV